MVVAVELSIGRGQQVMEHPPLIQQTHKTVSSSGTYYFRAYNSCGCPKKRNNNDQYPGSVTVNGGGTFCNNATLTASGGSGGTIYRQGKQAAELPLLIQ